MRINDSACMNILYICVITWTQSTFHNNETILGARSCVYEGEVGFIHHGPYALYCHGDIGSLTSRTTLSTY